MLEQLYSKILFLPKEEISLSNTDDSCSEVVRKLIEKPWYEWFGCKECPHPPASFHSDESLLAVYAVKYLCDHMDLAGYEEETFQLLTSLSFIQAALEVCGLTWLRDQYMKRSMKESWNEKKKRSVLASMMRFCNILLGAADPKKNYLGECWSKEVCTQLVARLNPSVDDRVKKLIQDASSYIESNGGILLKPHQSLAGPDGACEAILQFSSTIKAVTSYSLCDQETQERISFCVIACENKLHVYHTTTLQMITVLECRFYEITSVCVLSDGRVVSGSRDKKLLVWNVDSGKCEKVLKGHSSGVTSVCVLSDGRVVSGSGDDRTLRVWNVDSGECEKVFEDSLGVTSICVLSDGRVASGSYDTTIRVWNVTSGKCEKVLEGHSHTVASVCVLSDDRVVSGSRDTTIRVWNVDSGKCEKVLEGHTGGVASVCVLSDGRVVSGSEDSTLRVWNVDSGECECLLPFNEELIVSKFIFSQKFCSYQAPCWCFSDGVTRWSFIEFIVSTPSLSKFVTAFANQVIVVHIYENKNIP